MGETKVRYSAVRVADKTDDQKTAVSILNALASSVTQEDLQEFILSQLKRIIFGDKPGHWNEDFATQEILTLDELTHRSGFEVPANCLATDSVGDVVYIRSDSVGGVIQVTRVNILDYARMPGIGIITSKVGDTDCKILRYGILSVTGLLPGKTYFVGSDGRLTHLRPMAPMGEKAFIQVLGVAMDSGRLLLNPSFNLTRVTI